MSKTEREVYADSSEAIKRLTRNGIGVNTADRIVEIPQRKAVGIKLWGAVDYLKRFNGYGWGRVR
jgi:hypothetical protein